MKLYESNLGGGQFICRETCCLVYWARENILQPKEKNGSSHFPWRSHLSPYFDFTLMNVYRNAGIK